jgi:fused signal recognition particle receptor
VSESEATSPAGGWLARLKAGLQRSTASLADGIAAVIAKRKLDLATLGELEEVLIQADLGPQVAARLVAELAKGRFDKEISGAEIRAALAQSIAAILAPVATPLTPGGEKPFVILVVGVNGTGKTTTIGKLAQRFRFAGQNVMLVAGDTFRAAAIEQLQIWGQRAGVPVISQGVGADAAALAFDGLRQARAEKADVLLIDTAGRLHNKADLMAELAKIARVLKKLDASAPHAVLLVLDATTGQNALRQVEVFRDIVAVTGLVVTKLDGTARGGVLVAVAEKFALPIHFIGVGEGVDDLQPFDPGAFARALTGLPS